MTMVREHADEEFPQLSPWLAKHTWDQHQTLQRKFFCAMAAPVTMTIWHNYLTKGIQSSGSCIAEAARSKGKWDSVLLKELLTSCLLPIRFSWSRSCFSPVVPVSPPGSSPSSHGLSLLPGLYVHSLVHQTNSSSSLLNQNQSWRVICRGPQFYSSGEQHMGIDCPSFKMLL